MIRLFEPGFFDKDSPAQTGQTEPSPAKNEMSLSEKASLAETSSWCRTQTLTATPEETSDIRRRRALVIEAGKLYSEARKRGEKYPGGPLYKRGMALFQEADMASLVLLREQLRSPELLQVPLSENLSTANFAEAVSGVVSNRHERLNETNTKITRPPSADAGKLLHYWPHENLACGAAEYSSNGFFDVDNVPPWDTWVSFDGLTLISWVPAILIPLAQAGIDANPEECISWAR
jgi:hypothetical protein